MHRENTKEIRIGDRVIGGGHPVAVQSMTNTKTEDVEATVRQIRALEEAGCDIIRCAVPTAEAAEAIGRIRKQIGIPLVADIHFDHRLAIASIENGADAVRINPGNIGDAEKVRAVVEAARRAEVPIRVGVNSGSVDKETLAVYGKVTAEAMVESGLREVRVIEEMDFDNIVVSIKSSDVRMSVEAYERMAVKTRYPLHLGITEAGTPYSGTVRSAVGLGILLNEGIGDTIRVSLSGDPVEEIRAGIAILNALDLRRGSIRVISCPTCGRTQIDLIPLAQEVERRVEGIPLDIKVAVMGCVVNGPGEAADADIAICGGKKEGVLYRHGKMIRKVPEDRLLEALMDEILHWGEARKDG